MDEGFAGNRDMYITSKAGISFRVRVVTKHDGTMVVSGPRWRAFCLTNLNDDVELLHFSGGRRRRLLCDRLQLRRPGIWWIQHTCRSILKVYGSCPSLLRCAPGNCYINLLVCYMNMAFTYK